MKNKKLIKYKDTDWIKKSDDFTLLIVRFTDSQGNVYEWAPKWNDLQELFQESVNIEEFNFGRNWFGMAETALKVLANLVNSFNCRGLNLEMPTGYNFTKDDLIKVCRLSELKK